MNDEAELSTTALVAQRLAAPGKQQALYQWLEDLVVPADIGPDESDSVRWMCTRLFLSRAWDSMVSHAEHQKAIDYFGKDAYYKARAAVANDEEQAGIDFGKLFD